MLISGMVMKGDTSGRRFGGRSASVVKVFLNCSLSTSALALGAVTFWSSVFSRRIPLQSDLLCFMNLQNFFMPSYWLESSSGVKINSRCLQYALLVSAWMRFFSLRISSSIDTWIGSFLFLWWLTFLCGLSLFFMSCLIFPFIQGRFRFDRSILWGMNLSVPVSMPVLKSCHNSFTDAVADLDVISEATCCMCTSKLSQSALL